MPPEAGTVPVGMNRTLPPLAGDHQVSSNKKPAEEKKMYICEHQMI